MKKFTILRFRLATLLLTFTLANSVNLFAQQEPMFSQYMFNTLAINPAYAGSRDVLSTTALYRAQWLGVPGAPTTMTFSMDMPFSKEKMGIGVQAFQDAIGLAKNTGAYLTYAYRVKVTPRSTLAFGVQGGAMNIRWALSDAQNVGNDPVFGGGFNVNRILPNFGGGIYLSNDRGYIGVSCPQILQHSISNFTTGVTDSLTSVGKKGHWQRHFFTAMGFVVGKGTLKLKPSMVVRYTPGAPIGVDGNLNLWIKDKIAFGVSGRMSQFKTIEPNVLDAAVGMIELQLTPQLRLGYSYDFTLNKLNTSDKSSNARFLSTPTHEGMLRYEFGYGKNKILTPRYF